MTVEQPLVAVGGGDQLRDLRRQEALELADALDLAELGLDAVFQRLVPVLELVGLLLQFCRLLLHRGMRGFQLAALQVHFGEQPRIAHRQHRLVRKGLHQADQALREIAGVAPQHHQRAEHAGLVSQRHHQHRVEAGGHRDVAQRNVAGLVQVRNRNRLAGAGRLAQRRALALDGAVAAFRILVDADRFRQVEAVARGVIGVDQHRVGMGDFQRARRHRRQHRVEIERGGDRAADLFQHLQLVDGLREVAGALLHLPFEVGVGLLQLRGHAVELSGELFQLIGGLHLDAVAELAFAEQPRAGGQRGDRDQHAPRQ